MTANIELRAWTPAWANSYRRAVEHIQGIVGAETQLEHVGSTSVAGLAAKPILDILIGTTGTEQLGVVAKQLTAAGFRRGIAAPGAEWAEFLRRAEGSQLPALNLHLSIIGDRSWTDLIAFRDRLRATPQLVRQYEALKRELANRFPDDLDAYTTGKNEFVAGILERSL